MAPRGQSPAVAPQPDSPRASQSPAPSGIQGELEMELVELATSLYNLGTTTVTDSTKERDKPGAGKPVGALANAVIGNLASLDDMAHNVRTMIPLQVLTEIDQSRNPMALTREHIERVALENQFMNGKITALQSYQTYLDKALAQHFPGIDAELPSYGSTARSDGSSEPIKHELNMNMNGRVS